MLLIAFHIGQGKVHIEEMLDKEVSLDFFVFTTEEIKSHLQAAGFRIEEAIERDPYPESVEYKSRRTYIFARNEKAIARILLGRIFVQRAETKI